MLPPPAPVRSSMLKHDVYYGVKPYLPRWLRMAARSWLARLKRRRVSDRWPIDPAAGDPPPGWRGWPEGKRFAFVLTHDVEGPIGLEQCERLMELEAAYGFRSSFNFVPEGDYRVPADLRARLEAAGCEIGVHDLNHDGKLYKTRGIFRQKAARINRYLAEWNACGFRGAFMLRNLDWIHDLDIAYDLSTFDTDPFEPQPDGAGTIFPFWIPRPDGQGPSRRAGYMELPYTLPQDSTVFLLLQEDSVDLWMRKLRWVAARGGMALVNIHPDYIDFKDRRRDYAQYPSSLLKTFLDRVNADYEGQFWRALPSEAAQACAPDAAPVAPARRPTT